LVCPKRGSDMDCQVKFLKPKKLLLAVGILVFILCIATNIKTDGKEVNMGKGIYDDIVSFQAEVGGFLCESYIVTADWPTKKLSYRGGPNRDGNFTEFKRELRPKEWQQLIDILRKCDFEFWLDDYYDHTVLDGTQWSVKLTLADGRVVEKSGSNSFPKQWEEFCKGIAELVGDRFE